MRVEDGEVTVRPLPALARRGKDEEEDRSLAEELLADPKERAEHIMLVDLGRNDVGMVAEFRGRSQVTDLMTVERYSHVMHISSNVSGQLAEGKTAFDALEGRFTGGYSLGCSQAEGHGDHRRGGTEPAGALRWSGRLSSTSPATWIPASPCRTLVLQGKTAYVQAGCGVVYDSVPADEYEETLNKARGLLKAIEIAETQLKHEGA